MCEDEINNSIEDYPDDVEYDLEEDDDNYCPECGLDWSDCECDD